MRRTLSISTCLLVIWCLAPSASEAATMRDIEGDYVVTIKSSVNVARFGRNQSVTWGDCNLTASDDLNGIFTLTEYTNSNTYVHTGNTAIIPGGKKASFNHDADGLQELVLVLTNWMRNWAASQGGSLTGVSFDFQSMKYSPISIRAITMQRKPVRVQTYMPRSAKLTIKGMVSGFLNGVFYETKFTYSTNVTFVERS